MGMRAIWHKPPARSRMERYLLGELSGEAMEELEQSILLDDNVFAEMLACEEALIEDYLNDRLDSGRLELFEQHFLGHERRRERVEQQRLLRRVLHRQQRPPSSRRILPWLLTAASLTIMTVLGFIGWNQYVRNLTLQRELAEARARTAAAPPLEVSFHLRHSFLRSESQRQWIWVPSAAMRVALRLEPPAHPFPGEADARLETVEGVQVWSGRCTFNLQGLSLRLPGAVFRPGDYLVLLEQDHLSLAAYPLRVVVK